MTLSSSNTYHCYSTPDEVPLKTKYFENFIIDSFIHLSDEKENIRTILSIKSNIIVSKLTLCENTTEIKELNCLKDVFILKLELKVLFQIKYVGGNDNKSVFVENSNFYKTIYILVPEYIGSENIKDLYRKNKIHAQVYCEDLQTSTHNNKCIKFSLLALANVSFINSNILIE